MKEDEVGGACGTRGGEAKYAQGFGGENWRKETTWNM